MTATAFYKVVMPDGSPTHGGSGPWPLPAADGSPGAWREIEGELEACRNGLHIATAEQLPVWLKAGAVVYRAEPADVPQDAGGKHVSRKVRLHGRPLPCDSVPSDGRVSDPAVRRAEDAATAARNAAGYWAGIDLPKGHAAYHRAQAAQAAVSVAYDRLTAARARASRKASKAFAAWMAAAS